MEYRQAPPLTKEEMESLFHKALTARFCSINKNGTIHAVPVWFNYVDGNFIFGAHAKSKRARNIRRNKNVTLLIDHDGPPTRGVIIYGEAEIRDDNIADDALEMFKRYMPPEEAIVHQRGLFKLAKWVGVYLTPKEITSFDYGKDMVYRAAVKDEL